MFVVGQDKHWSLVLLINIVINSRLIIIAKLRFYIMAVSRFAMDPNYNICSAHTRPKLQNMLNTYNLFL